MKPKLLKYDFGHGIRAFSTTRHGGMSKGLFGQFNINPYCGDELNCIATNSQLLAEELGIDTKSIILPHQVHKTHCQIITTKFLTLDDNERKNCLEATDALITNVRGICIGVSTADCIPILLYDESNQATAAIHAGWRGTMAKIVKKALLTMEEEFGTKPENIKAVIGPGISLQNFEVGEEVYLQFAEAGFDMEKIARKYAKWHIDLPQTNKIILTDCGVSPENIAFSGICTYSHVDDFFSARRLGTASGRIYTGIIM